MRPTTTTICTSTSTRITVEPPPVPDGKHRADDWGPREVIALTIIILAFVMGTIAMVSGEPEATIPAWVAALVGGIGIFYFKGNGGE